MKGINFLILGVVISTAGAWVVYRFHDITLAIFGMFIIGYGVGRLLDGEREQSEKK
jgi:hypothetical protein